jgi:uncharacterized membrane protein
VKKGLFAGWRTNFLTGFVVLMPALMTFALAKWLFGTIASITDLLLFFVPTGLTHSNYGTGPMYWYWSLLALLLAAFLIGFAGFLTRYYIGRQMIAWLDSVLLRVPLLNKIYGTIKQVNEAFTSGKRSSFKTVVLIEFPQAGHYAMGFITSEQHDEVQAKTGQNLVCVFIPTTPNPTSGFLILVPENKVTKLQMSVAEGIKYIVSLGAIAPEFAPPVPAKEGG